MVENGAEEIGPGLRAQAGGFGALGGGLASVFSRYTPKSPCRRWMIGKRNGSARKMWKAESGKLKCRNQSCCRWTSGRRWLTSGSLCCMADERGVGFAAYLAENSTPLWSHHIILRSDETWLPEWSGNLGGVQRWRSSVTSGVWCFAASDDWFQIVPGIRGNPRAACQNRTMSMRCSSRRSR